jgi:hypothetical protein
MLVIFEGSNASRFQEIVHLSSKEVAKDLADVEGSMKTFAENQIEAVLNGPGRPGYSQVITCDHRFT